MIMQPSILANMHIPENPTLVPQQHHNRPPVVYRPVLSATDYDPRNDIALSCFSKDGYTYSHAPEARGFMFPKHT